MHDHLRILFNVSCNYLAYKGTALLLHEVRETIYVAAYKRSCWQQVWCSKQTA